MPHGRLTPLGRQLRSVLASLRPTSTCAQSGRRARIPRHISNDNTSWTRARGLASSARGICNTIVRSQSSAATVAVQEDAQEDERDELFWPVPLANADDESYGVGRLAGIEEGAAFTGEKEVENTLDPKQTDQTTGPNLNVSLRRSKEYPMYYGRKGRTVETRLEKTLYGHIKREAAETDSIELELMDALKLSRAEEALLKFRGYSTSMIKTWTDIAAKSDPHESALQLEGLQNKHDSEVIPLFVLFDMLRRPYIGPRTLRVLLRVSFRIVENYERAHVGGINKEDLFTLFTLLLRRVRDVWPAAMESLVDMLLRYLPPKPETKSSSRINDDQLASLGFRLNKAMRLLAIPTSISPFKTLDMQESCIIRILRFLAEHDPPLEINRDGFRAVILMQLAQPKSENDRLWAELKSLSWPPWKEDRTAMDSDITAAEHGRSKAAETLERMREAGFAPYEWEKVAAVYTGWDIDRTPTIQTRVLFSSGKKRFESGAAMWMARIRTTRTIQEAWACYLAYEDQTTEYDQDVCLAMFRKLSEEDARVQHKRRYMRFQTVRTSNDVWPGDAIEIEPPPPSSHQHTYTRTSPPTVDGLYRQLREKGVVFEGHCLAFLISRANTLQFGLEYLVASEPVYPNVRQLLDFASTQDLSDVPDTVFAAFIDLLGRSSNFSLSKALPLELKAKKRTLTMPFRLDDLQCNPSHPLVHGIRLLSHRLPHHRPVWHAILRALGNSSSYQKLNQTLVETDTEYGVQQAAKTEDKQPEQGWKAAYTARRLALRIITLMRSIHLETDPIRFIALCNVAENLAVNCWVEMRQQALKGVEVDVELHSVAKLFLRNDYAKLLRQDFQELVGEERLEAGADGMPDLPSLIEIPSPAILHAYIRALGWMGDHTGLLDTVQWMKKYRGELQERRELDRNGEMVMRRAVVALRVFLERSWVTQLSNGADSRDSSHAGDLGWDQKIKQETLVTQPPLRKLQSPAKEKLVTQIKALVESVEDWSGWPSDDEVYDYCQHKRFQQFNR